MRMQQEAQRDAPDARESRPPCYSDAILMPRLDGSFASLDELGTGRIKHKRRRRKTEDADIEEEEVPLRRNRCRSEEVISMREVVTGSVRSPRSAPRVHPFEIEPIDRNQPSNEEEEQEGRQYESTDIMILDHSPGPSSRARSPVASLSVVITNIQPDAESFEEIRNFNQSNNTLERSPYAKRKLIHMDKVKDDKVKRSESSSAAVQPMKIDENHFKKEAQKENRSSSTDSDDSESSEFITIKTGKHSDSNSSTNEDGLVVINRPTSI